MSALDRVREKFKTDRDGTRRTRKSPPRSVPTPSAGFAGSHYERSQDLQPLPADLERRLRAHAERWEYSPEELADFLEWARADPSGWLLWVARAEQRAACAVAAAELARQGSSERDIAATLGLDIAATRKVLLIDPACKDVAHLFLVHPT